MIVSKPIQKYNKKKNHTGSKASVSDMNPASCDELRSNIERVVLFPDTDAFEAARTAVWNLDTAGMPLVIVKCSGADDIARTIKFANENRLRYLLLLVFFIKV